LTCGHLRFRVRIIRPCFCRGGGPPKAVEGPFSAISA
jgi:hypothetical protein